MINYIVSIVEKRIVGKVSPNIALKCANINKCCTVLFYGESVSSLVSAK